MKYDLTKFPVGEDDQQLKDDTGKLAFYKQAFIKALLSEPNPMVPGAQPLSNDVKMKRYALYVKLKKANGTTNLDTDEVAILSDAVMLYPTLIAGQCRDFLNQKED